VPVDPGFRPSRRHLDLGPEFYDPVRPAAFPRHALRFRNQRWAERVGLGGLSEAEWVAHFGRFEPLPGSLEEPLALRYHGHQFRSYNPDLGDGRGFLFAQMHDLGDGRLLDLGTKGSGRTPYSRFGDGRLTLKGAVREALATELLEARGVDTSKTFSVIETGEELERGDEPSPTRSAVLVRLSHSHIRIGTFQRLLFLDKQAEITRLVEYVCAAYLPEARRPDAAAQAAAFVEEVCRRVARTGAAWMAAGFVHGVLNTDNINVTGESFDYGPWRFLPALEPGFTAAYFDQTGLYAYGRQPDALLWNLTRLAECLLHLAPKAELERALGAFEAELQPAFGAAIARRLGVAPPSPEAAGRLAAALWTFLAETKAPFERVFFDWFGGAGAAERAAASPSAVLYSGEAFRPVAAALDASPPVPGVDERHPFLAGGAPVDMLIDEVEALWAAIAERDDWEPFQRKIAAIRASAAPLTPAPPSL
jgi:uncharacterized protein YdiU (UPF0061 family)